MSKRVRGMAAAGLFGGFVGVLVGLGVDVSVVLFTGTSGSTTNGFVTGAVGIDAGVINGATATAGLAGLIFGPSVYAGIVEGRYMRIGNGD